MLAISEISGKKKPTGAFAEIPLYLSTFILLLGHLIMNMFQTAFISKTVKTLHFVLCSMPTAIPQRRVIGMGGTPEK